MAYFMMQMPIGIGYNFYNNTVANATMPMLTKDIETINLEERVADLEARLGALLAKPPVVTSEKEEAPSKPKQDNDPVIKIRTILDADASLSRNRVYVKFMKAHPNFDNENGDSVFERAYAKVLQERAVKKPQLSMPASSVPITTIHANTDGIRISAPTSDPGYRIRMPQDESTVEACLKDILSRALSPLSESQLWEAYLNVQNKTSVPVIEFHRPLFDTVFKKLMAEKNKKDEEKMMLEAISVIKAALHKDPMLSADGVLAFAMNNRHPYNSIPDFTGISGERLFKNAYKRVMIEKFGQADKN